MMETEAYREEPVTVRLLKPHAAHTNRTNRKRIIQHWPGDVIDVPRRVYESLGPKNSDGIPRMELHEGAPQGVTTGLPARDPGSSSGSDVGEDDDFREVREKSDVEKTGTVDKETPDYEAMNRESLLGLVEVAGIDIKGSGRDGYVSKDDLVKALEGAG